MASMIGYKPGQGYWTRLGSALGFGAVVAFGASWVWSEVDRFGDLPFERLYLQGGLAAAILLLGGIFVYWLVYVRPKFGEFLIATEGEMKKVNWSTRREVLGSTWVVICISVIIASMLFVVDLGFSMFFEWIGVLDLRS